MKIPALDRGLRVLGHVIERGQPCKYSELKTALPGIGDASLNRLLKSLLASGHLVKGPDGLYELGTCVLAWQRSMSRRRDRQETIASHVKLLAEATEESAGFVELREDTVTVLASQSWPESIIIAETGSPFTLESDHAATVAILDCLPREELKRIVALPGGAISSVQKFNEDREQWRRGAVFADRSRRRIGVSRCAVSVEADDLLGALFLCMPSERLDLEFDRISKQLLHRRGDLLSALML